MNSPNSPSNPPTPVDTQPWQPPLAALQQRLDQLTAEIATLRQDLSHLSRVWQQLDALERRLMVVGDLYRYEALQQQLVSQQWFAADRETVRLIAAIAGVSELEELSPRDIRRFPCGELHVADIGQLYVRSDTGEMVPLETLVRVSTTTGPQIINHYNLFRSIEINGAAAPGYSSGQAIAAMERIANQILPNTMGFEWSGISLEELESGGQAPLIFGLGIVFVFLVLAAQYENFIDPIIILLAVPLAMLGALLAVSLRGFPNDVYCQVGLVMLIGLASKNAILIVEFANQLRDEGLSIMRAAVEAAQQRLRPILMTAISTLLGILPLVIATGAGAASRQSLGTAVFGGMIVSTVLSLFVVPVLYIVIVSFFCRFKDGCRSLSPVGELAPEPDRVKSP